MSNTRCYLEHLGGSTCLDQDIKINYGVHPVISPQ